MSQYIPSTAVRSEPARSSDGSAAQTGIAVTRSASAAARPSRVILPLLWPAISSPIAIVTTSAPTVAPTASPIAAPPAGSSPVA
jgi:hypothetical protein